MLPARIWRAPTNMTTAPTTPSSTADESPMTELAEDRPHRREGLVEGHDEDEQDAEGDQRHDIADAQQDDQGDGGGEQTPCELDQAGADQVPDPLDVAHDAGHERAGLVGIVVGDRQAPH